MSETVISVEGLSKRYLLGAAEKAGSFREAVGNLLVSPWRRLRRLAVGGGSEEFWALRDVSFEVKRGEVVGVIGRNGAGKSTLLKVLSRITPPTAGRIRLKGRVASLLEVGTGFHPELTGRENIYLNGAILGMSTAEIRRKFDEIVAFSEVERFLDTPVKRYSSGMYVRLAFAVAAHLEPEILIVDEVLAVGDAAFQKKCLGKMKEVSTGEGRTVLFVSHNMAAVQSLCSKGILLSGGHLKLSGSIPEVVSVYLSEHPRGERSTKNAECTIVEVRATEQHRRHLFVDRQSPIAFEVLVESKVRKSGIFVGINISTHDDTRVATLWSGFTMGPLALRAGVTLLCCHLKSVDLVPGDYKIDVTLGDESRAIDVVESAVTLTVVHRHGLTGRSSAVRVPGPEHGLWQPQFEWTVSDA
ncbi:MAG: polysaccharide ABC transporter ATP-binding protein [Tepidisphaerales bacterium]